MVRPTNTDELNSAWRALAGNASAAEGWRTIPLGVAPNKRFRAGRHFPGNEEALLVGFTSVKIPAALQLPQGRGFTVLEANLGPDAPGRHWVAMCRRAEGSLDIFTMMAIDVISNLNIDTSEAGLFQMFLTRIRAWQEFMRRGPETLLEPEAEVGLYGELLFLRRLLVSGVPPLIAIESWVGSMNGVQDFVLGHGAVEVKTTIASEGFSAEIHSLEQLDNSVRQPLFLAAERVRLDAAGATLPSLISEIRELSAADLLACSNLNTKLIHAGYCDAATERYKRLFLPISEEVFLVDESFPKLTRANVSPDIRQARYEIDLGAFGGESVGFLVALEQLGVM
jgi:hypothetical protein